MGTMYCGVDDGSKTRRTHSNFHRIFAEWSELEDDFRTFVLLPEHLKTGDCDHDTRNYDLAGMVGNSRSDSI